MIKELRKYNNLGTPNYFWKLFNVLKEKDTWTEKNISSYFYNKLIDRKDIFDGCIPLLKLSKIILFNKKTKEIAINHDYVNITHNKQEFQQKLLKGFLKALKKDRKFYEIFSEENISYDMVHKTAQIDYSAFGLKYANIRNLLIDFNFLKPHPFFPERTLMVNLKWKNFFNENFVSTIRKNTFGIKKLKEKLKQNEINGEKAEKFVLKFESDRLKYKKNIEWIAPFDTTAGYDILSFNNINSKEAKRLIEVKSYAGTHPYFYWTKNEIQVAQKHKENYFLYLVNRDKITRVEYKPKMISNPITNILKNDKWTKIVNKYFITNQNS